MVDIEAQIKLKGSREQIERVREVARDIIVSWNDYVSGQTRKESISIAKRHTALLQLIEDNGEITFRNLLDIARDAVNINISIKTLARDIERMGNANLIKKRNLRVYKGKVGNFCLISRIKMNEHKYITTKSQAAHVASKILNQYNSY